MVKTLADIYTILNGIEGFNGKVTYRAFPEGEAPALPFIVYLHSFTHTFAADNKSWMPSQHLQIELYTAQKDTVSEGKIEAKLADNCLVWDKTETYIESEHCYQILYEIEI